MVLRYRIAWRDIRLTSSDVPHLKISRHGGNHGRELILVDNYLLSRGLEVNVVLSLRLTVKPQPSNQGTSHQKRAL
jgi:hypothetical protein